VRLRFVGGDGREEGEEQQEGDGGSASCTYSKAVL
jgi:hypothetical protein